MCICSSSRWRTCSGELHPFLLCNLIIHFSAGKWSWTYFFSLASKHEHTHGCSLPCLLLVYTLIAVHLTLAQRVLHPSLTLNVDVRIISCTHVKRKQIVYSRKITQRLYCFPALPRYLEWFKLFFFFVFFYSIYGFINGTVIYTHVCILVCI